MELKVKFKETNQGMQLSIVSDGRAFDADLGEVTVLHDGQNGATFTPDVSDDGVLSWTNDRGLENPQPVNISGKDGKDGVDGKNGVDGKDGYTPKKGVDYFDGKDGINGKDGYTPIKGKDYFDGKDGKNGVDGYTPIKGKDYFDGVDGKDGANGKDGCGIYRAYISYDHESQRAFIADSAPNGRSWQIGDLVIDDTDPTHPVYSIEAIERGVAYISTDGFSMKGDPYTLNEADKAAIASAVISALPVYNGEVVSV